MRRRKDKIDSNQSEIVYQLRQLPGISVQPGHDDILVGYRYQTFWFEIKDPKYLDRDNIIRLSALKDSQVQLLNTWQGQYDIVTSLDEILDIIGYEE